MSPPDRQANVLTTAASLPFAETFARGLIARLGAAVRDPLALSTATIYLPTRRAARSFADTFARVLGGAALLPEFRPLGDVDEDEFLFDPDADDLDLAPAIDPVRRRLLLATLIKRWDETRRMHTLGFAQANALAASLARLMDDVERQGCDLRKLETLVPESFAQHWNDVAEFLKILRDQWPNILIAEKRVNPIARRNELLDALAKRYEAKPPEGLVVAAGSTGSIPATGDLLKVIARLPNGVVVLPGLDRELDEESWNDLDPGHPQYGMKQLLGRIGVARADVIDWSDAAPLRSRELLLREALRPAPTTDAWRALVEGGSGDIAHGLEGISLVEAADPAEEAAIIALALREALETPKRTAALVTPDRALARRVAAELERWDIAIDDSGGQPLTHTPPGAFLTLLADAADSGFAPVPLLALLKHPLAAMGDAREFRERARELDVALRGPRPDEGLDGIAHAIAEKPAELRAWFAELTEILRPLGEALREREIRIGDVLAQHIAVAERLSSPDELWRSDGGEKAQNLITALSAAAEGIPAIERSAYASLFKSFAGEIRIRPAFGKHPRLAILGPLEARLQSFDLVILGGLNEGTWPQAAAIDPWFSRPMRKTLGLEQPERAIGLSAHDFATLAAAPNVILTRATKSDGAPTVASRWVQRLMQLTNGLGLKDALAAKKDYVALSRALDDPGRPQRITMPAATPPIDARPDRLSVTDIETWVRDPYAIYAKRVLRLKPLKEIDAEIGPMERGSAIHTALERFIIEYPGPLPDDAAVRLAAIAETVFAELRTPKAAQALWRPRFLRAAAWFIDEERKRRADIRSSLTEIRGEYKVADKFTLYGVADRIDLLTGGGGAILDYKTGKPPRPKQIKAFLAPQLLLEAAMLEEGAFAPAGKVRAEALLYVWFSGGREAGAIEEVDLTLVADALKRLRDRIAKFADPAMPYHPRVRPYRSDISGDYDHLARVREWSLSGWEAQEE